MQINVITPFPEFFDVTKVGLLGKAQDKDLVTVTAVSPRAFTTDRHRSIDDEPYGGGSGMVLMPGPIIEAMEDLDQQQRNITSQKTTPARAHRVLLTPQGALFTQKTAARFASMPALTLVCGRYEGFDERIRDAVDEECSLGDFVMLGGEAAALAMIEATVRLLPNVLGNPNSTHDESHQHHLLEYPQYTRPAVYRDQKVPPVLLSGNHAAIARWRRKEALRRTYKRRPDLLTQAALSDEEQRWLAEFETLTELTALEKS